MRNLLPGCLAFVLVVTYLSITTPNNKLKSSDIEYRSSQTSGLFPRKIWQTWKVDPLNFDERDLNVARTWTSKNPGYRYEVLTDKNDVQYVETHYGPDGMNRPDIVYVYKNINARIIKADLLRYLVMYIEGGVYADIDAEAIRPLDRFIPERYQERDIDMVVGVEVDEPELKDHPILGSKSRSFCQWTFMCKPRLPVMLQLVDNILRWLEELARQQDRAIGDVEIDFNEVISGTGPSAFTRAILEEISLRADHPIDWNTFHDMSESKLVGGTLVLTVEAFAAGQGHSDSGNHYARNALVKHHYHASNWPTRHSRYKHPMYGEVEKCNWDKDCVREWDANTAAFDTLPEDEKRRQISAKKAMDVSAAEIESSMLAQAQDFEEPFFPAFGFTPSRPALPSYKYQQQ